MTADELGSLSDDQLAARLIDPRSERSVVAEAYRRFFPRMLRAAALILDRDAALAEDVVQECFAQLFLGRRIERLRDPGSLRQYLLASVRHAAIDLARTRGRQETLTTEMAAEMSDGGPAELMKEHPRLEAVLERLTASDREILDLRFRQGLAVIEIATRLQISYAAAAQRLSRAIHRAREAI